MKIHVLSDLHLEFAAFNPEPTDADVVVLAGELMSALVVLDGRVILSQIKKLSMLPAIMSFMDLRDLSLFRSYKSNALFMKFIF